MSKAELYSAHIWGKDKTVSVELIINGKNCKVGDIPASNELMKELVTLFKRHLPKAEDIS